MAAKNLLIVESPAKAKTIEKFLGSNFSVKSSYGHIRDLDKGNNGVDVKNNFTPKYIVPVEKRKVVKQLKDSAKKADEVWLATDEDREGEAISWHLCQELGLDVDNTKRIVFREITKPAIQKAIQNPRRVNKNLVNAQQARRILDRLVGFELSELLWRKVKNKLSAGRVQSVAVKLIVEKEREIQKHEQKPYFKVSALFNVVSSSGKKIKLKAELSERLGSIDDAQSFLEQCKDAVYTINNIEVKPSFRRPAAPFTTSTLQQDASRKFGFSVKRTMVTAQRLYEQGHITYMRTDSTTLSQLAVNTIANMIKADFGDRFLKIRKYKSKSSNAQEAHEAIRPTYIDRKAIEADRDMKRLYELIWKRAVASQMSNAELEKTTVSISISSVKDKVLLAQGEVMKFEGFLKLYIESTDDEEEENGEAGGILPPLNIGQNLDLDILNAHEKYTRPAARYTEASLVKKLEELGIGRPSTYAPTIEKIMEKDRGYVTKESRPGKERTYRILTLDKGQITSETKTELTGTTSNRLYPSDMGMLVTDFLSQHFENVMSYNFTAGMEHEFDNIAVGKGEWKEMLQEFYFPFHEIVEETLEKSQRAKGRRILGEDPDSGHSVLVQMTRYGPVVQIGTREEVGDGKPRFANLKAGQSMETIIYEEAMELFKFPKTIGSFEEKEIIISNGRFGPYIKFDDKFVNIPKNVDPQSVTTDRAIAYILEKRKEDAPIGTYQGLPITKGKGRFGPFIKWNEMFINVPKKIPLEELKLDQAFELIEIKIEKEANRYIKRWEEASIAIENGRWGPFIRFKKKVIKLPKIDGQKPTREELELLNLEQVKEMIEKEAPGSFRKAKK